MIYLEQKLPNLFFLKHHHSRKELFIDAHIYIYVHNISHIPHYKAPLYVQNNMHAHCTQACICATRR